MNQPQPIESLDYVEPPGFWSPDPKPWPGHLRICSNCCYKRAEAVRNGRPNACSMVGWVSHDGIWKHVSPDFNQKDHLESCSHYYRNNHTT